MSPVTSQPPPPPGQPPYGGAPYGQPQLPGPYGFLPPDHQQAVTVLILGILGLVLCQVISPFAWVMGTRVVREIDASGGQLGGRSQASAGRICGIIGTCVLGFGLLAGVGVVVVALIATATSTT